MVGINQIKTAALLGLLAGLLVLGGYSLVGNEQGLYLGLVFAALGSFSAWYYSDQAVLTSYQARPLDRSEAPDLYDLVANLSNKAGIPTPKLFVVPTKSPNAFATGRDPEHSTIAVTQGIIETLSRDELAGVLAHELTHIRNRDTLTQAVAATVAGALTFVGQLLSFGLIYGSVTNDTRRQTNPFSILFLVVVAPLAAGLVQMAISRTREYSADLGSVEITGNPSALASALSKLEEMSHHIPMNGNPAMAPLLIINPRSVEGWQSLFRTHPPTEERVRRLLELVQGAQESGQEGDLALGT